MVRGNEIKKPAYSRLYLLMFNISSSLILKRPLVKLLLVKDILVRHLVEKRISYKIVELLPVIVFGFLGCIKGRLPVPDLFVGLAAAVPDKAVGNKKLTGDRFSFVEK